MLVQASAVRGPLRVVLASRSLKLCANVCMRAASTTAASGQLPHGAHVQDIRNIGIIAHVDAGKTTTTERMLYCSGVSHRQGKVDDGSTVTDFLPLEREKGITIQSAAVTFHWPLQAKCPQGSHPKTINLIDTPGHQDFRFEVDRCLPVLDGAVCIIDGVEGVEAHTERVWASAQEYNVPRIVFINKLDRDGASFRKSVIDIGVRLNSVPVVCQIPWYDKENFVGVVDVLDRIGYRWTSDRRLAVVPIKSNNAELSEELDRAKQNIIEVLGDHDDEVADRFLEDPASITKDDLKAGLRRVVRSGNGAVVPVFAGAALKSIGVEPLLDAVVDYLPSPDERPELVVRSGPGRFKLSDILKKSLDRHGHQKLTSIASVFKVFNHPKEGLLSFIRIYDGILQRNTSIWNTNMLQTERPLGMVQIFGNKTHTIDQLATGQIGAMKGLKHARTGDTIITAVGHKAVPDAVKHIQIRPPELPPPVAFLAIDPFGPVAAGQLETALQNASREDPSLRWNRDAKTDQFTIQGMGKLHLDIAVHGLREKYKIDAQFGHIEVDYKEHITQPTGWHSSYYDGIVASQSGAVGCSAMIEPVEAHHRETLLESTMERAGNLIHIKIPLPEKEGHLPFDAEEARQSIFNGAYAALARGPRRGSPLHGCHVTVEVNVDDIKSPTGGHFSRAARRAVAAAINEAHEQRKIAILEPVMRAVIVCPESSAGLVQHDITAQAGGLIENVTDLSAEQVSVEGSLVDASKIYAPPDPYDVVTSQKKRSTTRKVQITAKVPFKEMIDYDAHLRSRTGGRHSVTMEYDSLAVVTGPRERDLLL